ncbi:MAG: hypothetical protein ABIN58_13515 [candidate division WOR-3 bacterium]
MRGLGGDLNRYSYTRNNPVKYIDPSGHCTVGLYADESICVRQNSRGQDVIVTSDLNPVEQAIANAILTGDAGYIDRLPDSLIGIPYAVDQAYAALYGGASSGEMMAAVSGVVPGLVSGTTGAIKGFAGGTVYAATPLRGRFVRGALPPLESSYAAAFEGDPVIRTLRPGQKLYRAELSSRPPSRWFGTQPTTSLRRADRWWNILKYGPRDVLRVYEVTEPVTVYYGKVAGGRGTQILLPLDVKPEEVVRRIEEWPLK